FCCDQNGPSTRGEERSISQSIRDRRATRSPAHFHRDPWGRSQLAVFLRCSLGPYDSDMGARSRLEKLPTDFRQNICYFGDRTLGCLSTPNATRCSWWARVTPGSRPEWPRPDLGARQAF